MTTPDKKSLPPKSEEEIEADAAHEAACEAAKDAAKRLDASAAGLKRTISASKMQAVRLPTPSEMDLEAPAPTK